MQHATDRERREQGRRGSIRDRDHDRGYGVQVSHGEQHSERFGQDPRYGGLYDQGRQNGQGKRYGQSGRLKHRSERKRIYLPH